MKEESAMILAILSSSVSFLMFVIAISVVWIKYLNKNKKNENNL